MSVPVLRRTHSAFELLIPIADKYHRANPPTPKSLENAKPDVADTWRSRYDMSKRGAKLSTAEINKILIASAQEWRERYRLGGSGLLTAKERAQIKAINIAVSRDETEAVFAEPIMHFIDTPEGGVQPIIFGQHGWKRRSRSRFPAH